MKGILLCVVSMIVLLSGCARAAMFTDAERASILAYWSAPGRYSVCPAVSARGGGPWQARLTPAASRWLYTYQNALGQQGLSPTNDPAGSVGQAGEWETWLRARQAADWADAEARAGAANLIVSPAGPGNSLSQQTVAPMPAGPGPIPGSLLATAGNPPPLADAVAPSRYTVTFEDGEAYQYEDHVPVRHRFAYYRFDQGVVAYGPPIRDLPEADVSFVFRNAGMTDSEQRIARAVSMLEGGFESVNTYDTGCVSVGFIQCTTGESGTGSLCRVLADEKASSPADFQNDFRRFGVDVDTNGMLDVVDPRTGAEIQGKDAVQAVIDDKRLVAVFQRAGRHSLAFQTSQVRIARHDYWPADDPVSVNVGGVALTGKVSDFIHSEAGLATLFDRKVNRGNILPLNGVLTDIITRHHLTAIAQAAGFERQIISRLTYRKDFLLDPNLTHPN